MYLILDKDGIIRDGATEVDNLSVGYGCDDPHLINVNGDLIFSVGDSYVDGRVIKAKREDPQYDHQAIEAAIHSEMRRVAIKTLKKKGKIPADYKDAATDNIY